ncbi:MAG: FAD-dependent oxidoreductase [Sphingomicrobium sp.]
MRSVDVLIVGGGIAGASLGAEVAHRRDTLIVEAEAQCGFHATGRSAAFWLESYGGAQIAPLTAASRGFLDRPPIDFAEHGFLTHRGALHIARRGGAVDLPAGVEARTVGRAELERLVPGIRPEWDHAVFEPGCADIDVAALHAAYLRQFRARGGSLATNMRVTAARRSGGRWTVQFADGSSIAAAVLVDAAGAWADAVAEAALVAPVGIAPKRRTMVQLRVGRGGLRPLPLIADALGSFYFKGAGERSLWLSPHDEIDCAPGDAAAEEIDVATAIARFEEVVDWPVEAVERRWAGLRSFAPDRLPVIGFDPRAPGLFWCAGQGGVGIQTAPAAAQLGAALLLGEAPGAIAAGLDPAPFSPARFVG